MQTYDRRVKLVQVPPGLFGMRFYITDRCKKIFRDARTKERSFWQKVPSGLFGMRFYITDRCKKIFRDARTKKDLFCEKVPSGLFGMYPFWDVGHRAIYPGKKKRDPKWDPLSSDYEKSKKCCHSTSWAGSSFHKTLEAPRVCP